MLGGFQIVKKNFQIVNLGVKILLYRYICMCGRVFFRLVFIMSKSGELFIFEVLKYVSDYSDLFMEFKESSCSFG